MDAKIAGVNLEQNNLSPDLKSTKNRLDEIENQQYTSDSHLPVLTKIVVPISVASHCKEASAQKFAHCFIPEKALSMINLTFNFCYQTYPKSQLNWTRYYGYSL